MNLPWWLSLLGGAMIGASASLLLMLNGRVAGVSGIVGGLLRPRAYDLGWRASFVGGLLLGGIALRLSAPALFGAASVPATALAIAGLLVGLGTRLGGGCTSGHGVCGLSRLSRRSLVATCTFMLTGALAAYAMQHVWSHNAGGAP